MDHRDALAALDRHIARAARTMRAERWTLAFLPAFCAVLIWLGLVMSGVTGALGPWARSVLHVLGFLTALLLFARAWRKRGRTTRDEARMRIAREAGYEASAFETLDDQPAKMDAASLALWRAEQNRASARVNAVRAARFSPNIAARDPYRLRYVALVAAVAGAAIGWSHAPARLGDAFFPDPGPLFGDRPIAIEAWLTPAEYTGAAPIALSDRIGARIATPPRVEAVVRATGPLGAPLLIYEGENGRRAMRFVRAADGAFEARMTLTGSGRLRVVRYAHDKASWRIAAAPDAPPTATFLAPPQLLSNERAVIAWSAQDDFGVARAALRVRPVHRLKQLRGEETIDTPLELHGEPRDAHGRDGLILARHPYAGLDVEARIVAIDALGQSHESEPQRFRMPARVFVQPLARAAIEIRQQILWERRPYRGAYRYTPRTVRTPGADGGAPPATFLLATPGHDRRLERAPRGIHRARDLIDIVTMMPEDGYFRDLAVYASLRHAYAALGAARNSDETRHAAEILWRAANRAEYGGAVDTRRQLDLARDAVSQALQQSNPDAAVQESIDALRAATQRYLQALAAEAVRNGASQETREDTEEQTEITTGDLENMLREAEQAAREGRREDADRIIQQLQQILANLEVRVEEMQRADRNSGEQERFEPSEDGDAFMPQENGEQVAQQENGDAATPQEDGDQSLEALQETMDAQRALADETRQQQSQGEGEQQQEGGSGGQDMAGQGLAQTQAAVREQLETARETAQEAGVAPSDTLSDAENAMRRAEDALRRGDFEEAGRAQENAMARLREGADSMADALRDPQTQNRSRNGQGGASTASRDPLGRETGGGMDDSGSTQIPTAAEHGRSQEIVDEIRRRAQDARRSEAERAYLRRLLDRFDRGEQ